MASQEAVREAERVEELIDEVRRRLVAHFGERLFGLALFGSRARGDAGPESDLDMFLVAEGLDPNPLRRNVSDVLGGLPFEPAVALVPRTPEEFLRDIQPLDLDLALDARILHERDSFLTRHLAVIRDRIEQAGLYRTSDLMWRWRRIPRVRNWSIRWDGVDV